MRVLLSLAPPESGATRFVDHIVEGTDDDIDVRFFRWKTAIKGHYDVFHLHWPERLVRRGRLRTVVLLSMLSFRRIPIIRTLHNVRPHESGDRLEALFLRLIDRRTTLFVRLNDFTEVPGSAEAITILHPHYIDRVGLDAEPPTPGRLLYFGIIRPYKGVDTLLEAFSATTLPDLSLRFVGSATGDRGDSIRKAQGLDPRISSELRYVDDADLVREIQRSELTVFPFRSMHNSGSVLLALSVGRPVLVPRTAVNEALSEEVGPGWVYQYDGALSETDIERCLADVRLTKRAAPDLSRRDWRTVGGQLSEAYRRVLRKERR